MPELHQRTPLFIGNADLVTLAEEYIQGVKPEELVGA